MNQPLRPTWNHQDTKILAALEVRDDVYAWTVQESLNLSNDKEFFALLCLALFESPDAYLATRYVEQFFDWPANFELVKIFEGAFNRLRFLKTQLVHDWVMKNSVRFPADVGQVVQARIGDLEIRAKITSIIAREASAVGTVMGRDEKTIRIHAEEVLRVISLDAKRTGPKNFQLGGTPPSIA